MGVENGFLISVGSREEGRVSSLMKIGRRVIVVCRLSVKRK